jgi:hypothetical protein
MKKLKSRIATRLDCKFINAVKPDDVDVPSGVSIRHECVGGRWVVEVECQVGEPEDILTVKNTLDDIVRAIQVIERALSL